MGRVSKVSKRLTTSKYQGVTLMKSTNRWRAQKNTQSLGEYDSEEKAAQAFDRASINLYGRNANLNFPLDTYEHELDSISAMSFEEIAQKLRDNAITATPTSSFRGVSYLTACKKWRAQININNKQYHLGYYSTEEEAAKVFDRASIVRGTDKKKTKLNFDIKIYQDELPYILDVSIEELQNILDDEKVGWKVAKSVLSSGNWVGLNQVMSRPLKPQNLDVCQDKMEQLAGSIQKATRKLKRKSDDINSTSIDQNSSTTLEFMPQLSPPQNFCNSSQSSYGDQYSGSVKKLKMDDSFSNQRMGMNNFGNVQFNSTPSQNSLMDSDSIYPYYGLQSSDTQRLDKNFNGQSIYRGKENLQPDDVFFQGDYFDNNNRAKNRFNYHQQFGYNQVNSFGQDCRQGSILNKSFHGDSYGAPTANERLIGLMSQQGFPQEIISVVEDFDTDISLVRHAGAWKILRFMIQYSPQKFDHLDEMWLKLQNLIEFVLEQCPRQLPMLQV